MIIYKAMFGKYDRPPKPPAYPRLGERYVVFTDYFTEAKGWHVFHVTRQFENPARENRYYKLQPHRLFPGEVTVYLDGSTNLIKPVPEVIRTFVEADATALIHTLKSQIDATVRTEMEWISRHNIVDPVVLKNQFARYVHLSDRPTSENRILISYPGSEPFYDVWWDEVKNYGHRDQLSLPYAEDVSGIRVHRWAGNRRELMTVAPHRRPQLKEAV